MATQVTLNSGSVDSAGSLALKTNGTTTAVTINASQGVEFNAGAVGTPSITTTGDTNTGIFFPAADTIAFSEGGVEAARFDSSGRLGIGTTSPASQLHIYPSTANVFTEGLRVNREGQTGQYAIVNYSSGVGRFVAVDSLFNSPSIGFFTSSDGSTQTERARIDSSGNLLVGTTGQPVGGITSRLAVSQPLADYSSLFVSTQSTAANCYGARIQYTAAAPNGSGNAFLVMTDTGGDRAYFKSNGGLANYSANNTNLSDVRTKTDIQDAGSYLSKICAIPVRTFKYKNQTDDLLSLGVIAQEVEDVAPELVDVSGFGETPKDGVPLKAIYQTDLQYALMKSIQELKAIVDAQAVEIAALKGTA